MAASGLAADARKLVLAEDVVLRAPGGGDAPAIGLVYRVAGQSDDEALSDSEDEARNALRLRAARAADARGCWHCGCVRPRNVRGSADATLRAALATCCAAPFRRRRRATAA